MIGEFYYIFICKNTLIKILINRELWQQGLALCTFLIFLNINTYQYIYIICKYIRSTNYSNMIIYLFHR